MATEELKPGRVGRRNAVGPFESDEAVREWLDGHPKIEKKKTSILHMDSGNKFVLLGEGEWPDCLSPTSDSLCVEIAWAGTSESVGLAKRAP